MSIRAWALYPWFEEHGVELVHPDDLSRFRQLRPYGKVFAVLGSDGGYTVLQFGEETYRVMPDLMALVSEPGFVFGQTVKIAGKSVIGTVVEICWHHGKSMPFFHLCIEKKRSGKRYWKHDLSTPE